jgi:hypothetical protein
MHATQNKPRLAFPTDRQLCSDICLFWSCMCFIFSFFVRYGKKQSNFPRDNGNNRYGVIKAEPLCVQLFNFFAMTCLL